ncbi:PepSY domain-containing protein [Tsuneonella suprasediminis]|uniref:PepSY domain-containing protein n=1 Tax=Tsuneonella suprasediminis TaxID=2306996 RepID=A0A419QZ86_9SPHN|nr:PepSY-associated TM helix domain-containing protein [Tsuneonella suprasediminis]RJX65939.1 PepSY domain-containing protein [Tsuneonella suprasediminis]
MSQTRTEQPGLVKRALAGHGSIALLACALIYIIAISGTIVVVAERWQRWEQPNVAEYDAIAPSAVQNAMVATLALEKGKAPTEHLYVRMPSEDLPRAVVTTDNAAWYVDQAGKPVAREAHSWTEFLLALHINLTLPVLWGMLLVGVIGVALAAITLTGVLALPKIFKDAFRLRSRHDPQIARADWHNRLGAWSLPFALVIALTGAFIGLSFAGAALLAQTDANGDMEAVYGTIFGGEPEADPAPAPLANVARALATVQSRFPDVEPIYAIVEHPGTRSQLVMILAEHPRRLIYGESYRFNGAGDYLGKVGLSDGELGKQAAASTYNLHFGNYAGLPVELAYIAMGLAMCVITSTGTTLWLLKRRRKGIDTSRLSAGWSVVIWGTPLAIVLAVWVRWLFGPEALLAAIFWLALLAGIAVAALRPTLIGDRWLKIALAGSLAVTAVAHVVLFRPAQPAVLALDIILLAMAAAVGLLAMRVRSGAGAKASTASLEPLREQAS